MIVLNSGDKLRADSTVASKVDYTIHGLDNNALKQLGNGQLAGSTGDIYTADSVDVITGLIAVNTHTVAVNINLFLLPASGTARRLIPKDIELGIGFALYFEGSKCHVLDTTGKILQTWGTYGIANGNTVKIDALDVADDEYARFTVNGLESRTSGEMLPDLLSNILPENTIIQLASSLSADGKYSGITEAGTLGATIAYGELMYFKAADSKWYLAKADVAATSSMKLGICLVGGNANDATKVLLHGKINAAAKFPTFTIGSPVFISAATAGQLTMTAPSGTTNFVVRIVGWGNTADELYFAPSTDWVELK